MPCLGTRSEIDARNLAKQLFVWSVCTFNVGPFTLALRYLFACMLCLCVFDGSRAQRNTQANECQHQTRTRTHDGILIRTSTPLTTCGMDSNIRFGTQEHTFHLLRLAFYALGMHRKQVDLDLCMRCRSPRFGCWLHSDGDSDCRLQVNMCRARQASSPPVVDSSEYRRALCSCVPSKSHALYPCFRCCIDLPAHSILLLSLSPLCAVSPVNHPMLGHVVFRPLRPSRGVDARPSHAGRASDGGSRLTFGLIIGRELSILRRGRPILRRGWLILLRRAA